MMTYKFDCGCEFPIINEEKKDIDGLPSIRIDYNNLNERCPGVWELFAKGQTKGIFQLETNLGQGWAKKLQPVTIEEVGALTAILRPGMLKCLSKDTKISYRYRDNPIKKEYIKVSIEKLYKLFHNRHNTFKSQILSVNNSNLIILNNIKNIWKTGIKKVYKPKFQLATFKNRCLKFYSLECTLEHKLLTKHGFKQLQDIQIGEYIALSSKGDASIVKYNENKEHKHFKHEKSFRDVCFRNYEYRCVMCDWKEGSLDVNHLDGNRKTNNNPDNLCFLCPNHHRMYSEGNLDKNKLIAERKKYKLDNTKYIVWGRYIGYDYIGEKETYDIEMESPYNNFIAGNVVVHNSMLDGKTMTQHFVDRKHGYESFEFFHELAEPILAETYGTMTYQEQILSIAKVFAGFNLQQADTLRKGIGKKKADVVAKCRKGFIDGCNNLSIIDEDLANEVFDNIEKANRYSFNKSHAICYGDTAFMCAVPKYHFPLHFFTAWLSFAKQKIKPKEEIADLVQEAKQFKIVVENPNISYKNSDFIIDNGKIRYGLGSIKSVGVENVRKFLDIVSDTEGHLKKELKDFTWHEVLLHLLTSVRKDVVNNLIHAGALSSYGISRQRMLFEYNKMHELKETEIEWIKQRNETSNIADDIENVVLNRPKMQAKRREKLQNLLISVRNPSSDLTDSTDVMAACEEDVLGIALSCTKLDSKNLGYTTCTCEEFINGTKTHNVIIALQLSRVTEWVPKNSDKKLCFLTGFDKTGRIEIMVPSQQYEKYGFLLFNGNTVTISGSINAKSNLTAKVITQL